MIGLTLLLLAQAVAADQVPARTAPIAGHVVADPVLAQQRGGFRLPSGIDVALSIETQTAVDGAIVLRTVFHADQGQPSLTILAPRTGETVALPAGTEAKQGTARALAPTISYDRSSGLQVVPGGQTPSVSVATAAGSRQDATPAGLAQVSAGTVTDAGAISESIRGGTRSVSLERPDLTITHLAGGAFGSVIANSGNDRAIDTQTALSINLSNAGPDVLGSAMFRVQDVGVAALTSRVN